jgi:cell division protein FtsQ
MLANPPQLSVANQSTNRTRSFVWEDDASAEPRFRRVQQSAPGARGLPLDMDDGSDSPKTRKRFAAPGNPWWRPSSTWGKAFLATGLLIGAGCCAYAFHVCRSFLDHDARFRIAGSGDIQASGLAEVSRAEVLPVFGEDIGRNIFYVPLAQRRKQLEQIPWIQKATVMRILPDQIQIAVVERQPVAFVRHGQQIGLVDANGVLLSMPPALLSRHHYSFPVLTGMDAGDPLPSRRTRVELYERLVADLDSTGQHLSDQLSEIDLTDPEDARVLMPEQGSDILAHFGEDHFLDRFQRYKAHIAEWRQQYPKLAAVDLRYDQQVVLEMKQGAASDPAAATPAENKVPAAEAKPAAGVPEATTQTARAGSEPKGPKPHVGPPAAKSAAAQGKQARVNALAARMREKRQEQTRHAAMQRKQKSQSKPRASVYAVQGQ